MNRSWWTRVGQRRVDDRRKAFIALGVAASLLLLAFVLETALPAARGFAPRLPVPEFAAFLPPGAEVDGAALELAALPQSSYVVTYRLGGTAHVALVVWDREAAKYALDSSVRLDENGTRLDRAAAVSFQPMGAGDPLILARGPFGAYTEGVFALARDAQGLGIVRLVAEDGERGPAFFLSGASAMHSEELSFEDADGDGRKEAIAVTRETTDGGVARTLATVYRFTDGAFVYDRELSRLLTITKSLFPEPEVPAAE